MTSRVSRVVLSVFAFAALSSASIAAPNTSDPIKTESLAGGWQPEPPVKQPPQTVETDTTAPTQVADVAKDAKAPAKESEKATTANAADAAKAQAAKAKVAKAQAAKAKAAKLKAEKAKAAQAKAKALAKASAAKPDRLTRERDKGLDVAAMYAPKTIANVRKKGYLAKGDTVKTGGGNTGWRAYVDRYYRGR